MGIVEAQGVSFLMCYFLYLHRLQLDITNRETIDHEQFYSVFHIHYQTIPLPLGGMSGAGEHGPSGNELSSRYTEQGLGYYIREDIWKIL